MTFLRAFGRFWYEFLVGDDWRIVAGVTAILGLGALAVAMGMTGPAVMITVFLAPRRGLRLAAAHRQADVSPFAIFSAWRGSC